MVTLDGVEKIYGRQRVLAGVQLALRGGRTTAVLGANGAGKSTLVGVLATLVKPTRGKVRFGQLDLERDGQAVRRSIGLIAHSPLVYPDLTGHENLVFFARLHGSPEPRARADELIAEVGLTDARDRLARTYSRGMLQRLAVARALVGSPTLILADEPFTGLDRPASELLRKLLCERRERGAAVLLVTHELGDVAELADDVVVLRRGRVTHAGPVTELAGGRERGGEAVRTALEALYRERAL